jgi:predicted PurR-regulated permease PerM
LNAQAHVRERLAQSTESEPRFAAAEAAIDEGREPQLALRVPLHVRNIALVVMAVMAGLFALHWAKDVLVPLMFGVMISYALTPAVELLERLHLPRALGAGLVVGALTLAMVWSLWALSDQASALVDTLPGAAQKVRQLVEGRDGSVSTIAKVQAAANEIEAVAEGMAASSAASAPTATPGRTAAQAQPRKVAATQATAAPGHPTHVVVEKPRFDIRAYVLSGTLGMLAILGQVTVALLVALFMLASGNAFRRKMVKFAGPKLSQKRVTLETLNEIAEQIQRYLQVQVAVSVLVGVCTWAVFAWLGVNQSMVWGVVAAATNLIPYVGAVLVAGISAVVSLTQFGSLEMACAVGAASLTIHAVIGNLVTPWWLGRASRMSALVVFVAVLLFGWLWGIPGLLLGVPILMIVKSICDHIEDLKPIGELLSA